MVEADVRVRDPFRLTEESAFPPVAGNARDIAVTQREILRCSSDFRLRAAHLGLDVGEVAADRKRVEEVDPRKVEAEVAQEVKALSTLGFDTPESRRTRVVEEGSVQRRGSRR